VSSDKARLRRFSTAGRAGRRLRRPVASLADWLKVSGAPGLPEMGTAWARTNDLSRVKRKPTRRGTD